jgi:hypothetical protein
MLAHLPPIAWTTTRLVVPIPTGEAIVFDSAYGGASFEECLTIPLVPGDYGVDTAEYTPTEEIAFLLHRLTLR